MTKLAIIYHSAHGHTEHIALRVLEGAQQVEGVEAHFIEAEEMATHPHDLVNFDGFILGSPTYLGGVSGPFKSFMDTTGRLWRQQGLVGKLAAGFTVSSLPAGDKQSTLLSANRLGSWSGLMAQAGHSASADSFVPGDVKGARMFGRNFANTLLRVNAKAQRQETAEA